MRRSEPFFHLLSNQNGAAIVQMLIIFAVIQVALFFGHARVDGAVQSQSLLEHYESVREIEHRLSVFVSDPYMCQISLGGQKAVVGGSLTPAPPSPHFSSALINVGILVGKATLTGFSIESVTPNSSFPMEVDMKIKVDFQGGSQSSFTGSKSLQLRAVLNADSRIVSCFGERSAPYLCEQSGGVFSELENPKCKIKIAFSGTCPQGTSLTGFDPAGEITCQ